MKNSGFKLNCVLTLPPGFKFIPTDEELVSYYLTNRVLSRPLPDSLIFDANVYESDPWDLPGDTKNEMYFFSTRQVKHPNGNRYRRGTDIRGTDSGFWKISGSEKKIVSSRSNQVIGHKRTLVFYIAQAPNGSKTDWIIHEYRLATPPTVVDSPPVENLVLCRVFLKKKVNNSNEANVPVNGERLAKPSSGVGNLLACKRPHLNELLSYSSLSSDESVEVENS